MPGMPRVDDKAKKIADKILGVPANMRKNSKKKNKVEERLDFEETSRVR